MSEQFPDQEERYTCPIDQACQTEERMRSADLARARALSAPEQEKVQATLPDGTPLANEDGSPKMVWAITECVDCDDEIPAARLEMGKIRCVVCQGKLEARRKNYGA